MTGRKWMRRVTPRFMGDVITRAKRGDSEAVAMLYRNHVTLVHGYFRACGVSDADDLTSEVFVGMLRGLHSFEGDVQQFRTWLMTIAYRRRIDDVRRRASDRSVPHAPEEVEAFDPGQRHGVHTLPIDPALLRAFEELTDTQREILALRFIADLGLETVATITERPVGAVKSLQHRGLQSLRRAMATDDDRDCQPDEVNQR